MKEELDGLASEHKEAGYGNAKRKEWWNLVGKQEFETLDKRLQDFLINTAGMIDLGFPIDIKNIYKMQDERF